MRTFVCLLLAIVFSSSAAVARPVIKYGYDEDYPPWEKNVSGKPVGINIDIMNALAGKLGFDVAFRPYPFKRVLVLLESGEIDMTGGLARSPEREAYARYLEPSYQKTTKVFIVRRGAGIRLRTYDDLLPLRIGVRAGNRLFEPFDSDTRLKKVEAHSMDQLFQMLLAGRTDVIVGGGIQLRHAAKMSGYVSKMKLALYTVETPDGGFFALSRASSLMGSFDAIESAFRQLHDAGVITAIVESHLR